MVKGMIAEAPSLGFMAKRVSLPREIIEWRDRRLAKDPGFEFSPLVQRWWAEDRAKGFPFRPTEFGAYSIRIQTSIGMDEQTQRDIEEIKRETPMFKWAGWLYGTWKRRTRGGKR